MNASNILKRMKIWRLICALVMLVFVQPLFSQDTTLAEEPPAPPKPKPVKNTFESVWIIDNQTVMVPIKGTFEMDFAHRFGVVKNGYKDFFGLFASSNIRLGAIQQMTTGRWPVSITYYGNAAIDTRPAENFLHFSDRLTYFNQIIIARKFNEKISAQIAPSVSHTNVVNGYYSEPGKVSPERKHNHFAVAFSGRYKLKESMAILVNYDQPLTKHKAGNPHPNLALGLEVATSAHAFQFFAGNYYYLSPQQNNMYNQYDYTKGEWLIGFNITRLWNY
jgi:hypothetical protein